MKFSDSCKALVVACAVASIAACSDSTGPTSLATGDALQSLAIGLTQYGDPDSPTEAQTKATLDAMAPLLDKVSVTFDGAPQEMYALAIRQTFPAGTCEEAVFIDPQFPSPPGECTPVFAGVETVLWQTRSASKAPDKLIVIMTDVGINDFDLGSNFYDINGNAQSFPAFAIYIAGQNSIFGSESGSLTTNMTPTGPNCDVPKPPYARSATCGIATFTESGTIAMTEFGLEGPTGKTLSLGIPSITMDGLWIDITEVQPITLTFNRVSTRVLGFRGLSGKLQLHGFYPEILSM
jgi:hypothetical protein